ncbi:DUF2513 domain-containing protein [Enterobacter hormaechei]|uniref:DUF2513 domain-containing protein n=1 Tax=Enterobacter hormaechei TaxID=158836 RepID=UPI00207622E2|nr:DUF2513 domain-containing protein [Enterobacter hormaechei]MCM7259418.1 DUF2513 domain-containing protein [Enterobacter hormaechei]MDN5008793.1 DUF2513 domain-containing protein [Enterobacter hormaechei]MDO1525870.1 DUF2513 domain-containing protein [Enterobacter hormaechei]
MKRNWDLIREILVKGEALSEKEMFGETSFKEYDVNEVAYHLVMLDKAGFIEAINNGGLNHQTRICTGLTWEGYDFLDKIRDKAVWNRTKTILKDKGLELTFATIKVAATKAITDLLT